VYKECRKALEDLNVRSIIEPFSHNTPQADQQVMKYAVRILQKLNSDGAQ
jgi:hypothetical protein